MRTVLYFIHNSSFNLMSDDLRYVFILRLLNQPSVYLSWLTINNIRIVLGFIPIRDCIYFVLFPPT